MDTSGHASEIAASAPDGGSAAQPPATAPGGDGRVRAHAFFWRVLITAAVVSIVGNATHAVLHAPDRWGLAVGVAVVPPSALLTAVHGVAVLSRAHGTARPTRLLAIAMTLLITGGAFRLSFTALRSLALISGVPAGEAWLWPLIIEGSMAQATVALLVIAGPVPVHRAHDAIHVETCRDTGEHHPDENPAEVVPVPVAAIASSAPLRSVRTDVTADDAPVVQGWSGLAADVCHLDPARRRDPAEVAVVLARHFDDGWNATKIARQTGRSRSTISRIINDAARVGVGPRSDRTVEGSYA